MAQLTTSDPVFTIIAALDVAADRVEQVLDIAISRSEDYIRYLPGFVTANWLTRQPLGKQTERPPGPARILEYLQWRRRSDFLAFIRDPEKSQHIAQVSALTEGHHWETYQLDAVIAADPFGCMLIAPDDPRLTLVVLIEPHAGKQGWINEYNQSETHRLIKHLDGFTGASFLLGHNSERVTEYVQWSSLEAFQAAYADPRFIEHLHVVGHYAQVDWGRYEVRHCIEAPPREPACTPVESGSSHGYA